MQSRGAALAHTTHRLGCAAFEFLRNGCFSNGVFVVFFFLLLTVWVLRFFIAVGGEEKSESCRTFPPALPRLIPRRIRKVWTVVQNRWKTAHTHTQTQYEGGVISYVFIGLFSVSVTVTGDMLATNELAFAAMGTHTSWSFAPHASRATPVMYARCISTPGRLQNPAPSRRRHDASRSPNSDRTQRSHRVLSARFVEGHPLLDTRTIVDLCHILLTSMYRAWTVGHGSDDTICGLP